LQIFAPECRFKSAFICVYLRFRIVWTLFLLMHRRALNGLISGAPRFAGFPARQDAVDGTQGRI
jgi:hypothetical protein